MAKKATAAKKRKKKRVYKTDPLKKIKAGKPWTMHFDIDPDVAEKLIEEKKISPPGTQYQYLINKSLRSGYGLPALK